MSARRLESEKMKDWHRLLASFSDIEWADLDPGAPLSVNLWNGYRLLSLYMNLERDAETWFTAIFNPHEEEWKLNGREQPPLARLDWDGDEPEMGAKLRAWLFNDGPLPADARECAPQ